MKAGLQWLLVGCCAAAPALAALPEATSGPSLDLEVDYYTKVLTPEGVTREARYKETMVRRPGHVWVARILPTNGVGVHDDAPLKSKKVSLAQREGGTGHASFNYAVNPRHVMLENDKVRINFVDTASKTVVAVPVSEYGNVNFDGSWKNAFFLLDPAQVKGIPLSARASSVAGAQWHEREKNGVFERVLWDEKRQIPLVIESGDKAMTFYRRVAVTARAAQTTALPWQSLSGYAQKEFADYLD